MTAVKISSPSCGVTNNGGASRTLLLLLVAVMLSCTNSIDPPATTTGGGTLRGKVSAYVSSSSALMSAEGIQITLQGTSYRSKTDTAGAFEINNIPAGVYNIIFSKPGFDSMVYPAHHLLGVGTDIINDAYVIEESSDSVSVSGVSSVFTVSISKKVHFIDTIFKDSAGVIDTIVLRHDSLVISYDTVENANAIIVSGHLSGNVAPASLYVYSSLDSTMFPYGMCPSNPHYTIDEWLTLHLMDSGLHRAFQSPRISGGGFRDTLSSDIVTLLPYSLPAGATVYIYAVGHSNTEGLPVTNGEYPHYSTTPYGPVARRFRYVVP